MLVRFNKGPWHRKVREIPDDEAQRDIINIAIVSNNFSGLRTIHEDKPDWKQFAPGNRVAVYRIKMVSLNLGKGVRMVPSVFPDGPVCFEYERTY